MESRYQRAYRDADLLQLIDHAHRIEFTANCDCDIACFIIRHEIHDRRHSSLTEPFRRGTLSVNPFSPLAMIIPMLIIRLSLTEYSPRFCGEAIRFHLKLSGTQPTYSRLHAMR